MRVPDIHLLYISENLCGRIPKVWNSEVVNYKRNKGHTISIKCNAGYKLKPQFNGQATATCQDNGKWTSIPECTKDFTVPVDQRCDYMPFCIFSFYI